MGRLLFFLIPAPFLAFCGLMISLNSILGTINPEQIDRHSLVRVMQIRDFSRFSLDLTEQLTYRAEAEFGPQSPNKPVFNLSGLEKKIHVYCLAHRSSQLSRLEQNLTAMAKVRYFQWMNEFNTADQPHKADLLRKAVVDMKYWQQLYIDYIQYLNQPVPTPAQLLQDFQRMIEDFKVGASPEEVLLIDAFAQALSRALVGVEMQKFQKSIFNLFQ